MPVYATRADLAEMIEGLVIDDPSGFDRLIDRAELEVDRACGDWPINEATLRKFDPALLLAPARAALKRAVAAQVAWRLSAGEEFFTSPQREFVQGPDFTTRGVLDARSPAVLEALAGVGLIRHWATVRPPTT